MNYRDSEQYLYSLGNEVEAMKLGLENIRTLLVGLGNPQEKYPKVQVAGTNGKGSVCAFLDSICLQAGIKTGLFTSPHLVSITERVKIDGIDIGESEFARIAMHVRETAEKLLADGHLQYRPTFFEQMTAIALVAFAEAKVDLAILETGLGGRLDATTAANAEIAAITQIGLDHQEYLGDTIEQIAAEKAAIIRADSKVVLAHQSKVVERVLMGRCRELGVEPNWASTDIDIKNEPEILPALFGSIRTARANYVHFELWDMLGKHQFQNAAVAIAIAEELQDAGFEISTDSISIGVGTANHPGRLEYIGKFLLDGAHNVAGAKALAEFINEHEKRPITLIFGAMNDKNVSDMLAAIAPLAERIIVTKASNSRSLSSAEVVQYLPLGVSPENIESTKNVADALDLAKEITPQDGIILVTGSLYLVGEVKAILG